MVNPHSIKSISLRFLVFENSAVTSDFIKKEVLS